MAQAPKRRFPPAPGALGWLGLALAVVGLVLQFAAYALLFWLALNRNLALVAPFIGAFVISLGLLATAFFAFRLAWKRDPTGRPAGSAMTSDQRRRVLWSVALTTPTELIAVGAFVYLGFSLPGSYGHRLMLAAVPVVAGSLVSYLGLAWTRSVLNRPPPNVLGLAPRREKVLFSIVCLLSIALLLVAGLFVIPT